MSSSPLYRDSFALCGVLLEAVEGAPGQHPVLRRRLAEAALRLLEDVSLALAGFERLEAATAADAQLDNIGFRLAAVSANTLAASHRAGIVRALSRASNLPSPPVLVDPGILGRASGRALSCPGSSF